MVRNRYELSLIKKSGMISARALRETLEKVSVGITGLELDDIIRRIIENLGGQVSFETVPGYKWASCITINEQVVHGIPTDKKILDGDLISIDLGAIYKGWHTDCAWSVLVGRLKDEGRRQKENFLRVGEQALWEGIDQAVEGNRVGDISYAIQRRVEGAGYHVVRALVGHGIGKSLHEEPEVPGYGQKGTGLLLKSGMTLAIEAIYAKGTSEVVLEEDGWTFKTADGSLAGLFEMTVVVEKEKGEVLTDWRNS